MKEKKERKERRKEEREKVKKKESRHRPCKLLLKMDHGSRCKVQNKTTEIPEGNTRENLGDTRHGNDFSNTTPKTSFIKGKI